MNYAPLIRRPHALDRWFLALAFAVALATVSVSGADARRPEGLPPTNIFVNPPASAAARLPYTYAKVTNVGLPIYAHPADESSGELPVRIMTKGYLGISLDKAEPIIINGQTWYQINRNEYVRARDVMLLKPSEYQGVLVTGRAEHAFGWMISATRVSPEPGATPVQGALSLPRYSLVVVLEEQRAGAWTWYRVGEDAWIEQRRVGLVKPAVRPAGVGVDDKWVDVNLYEQTLAAYEGDTMVYATLVSTGLPGFSTPTGLFRIWARVAQSKMSGRDGYPDYYYLEDVPWILYFSGSVGLHGAYWHDGFGSRRSHGCVNLSPRDAKWIFDWATPVPGNGNWTLSSARNPGTWVWVH